MTSEVKVCQNCRGQFTIEPEDFNFYEKIKVPPPTFCPECRMIRRFIWRSDHHLFRRKDGASDKEIFSGFHKDVSAAIYDLDYWNSDAWDPMQYGREYDFSRPFFEQFKEFLYTVPWPAKSVQRMINSDYCDQAGGFKNCYLCFSADGTENSAYMVFGGMSRDSLDCYEVRDSELCYQDVMVDESYRTFFSLDCESCTDVWFSRDLIGCTNCFGCVGLRSKSYCIFNQPYSREEYIEKLKSFGLNSHSNIQVFRKRAYEFWLKFPVKFIHGLQNVNSTGEHMHNTKNVHHSFDVHGGENLKYCQFIAPPASDSYDYSNWGVGTSLMYECMTCGEGCSEMKFCFESWPGSRALEYSAFCRSSSDLFGCVSLKKKQYCIFNKQYSKEEYFALREKIIKHMNEMPYTDARGHVYKYGEFFPQEFSPLAYNESIANDFFKLTKEEALVKGYTWRDAEPQEYQTTKNAVDLPDTIEEVFEDILKDIIKCERCGKAYRIIKMELDFYRRIGLPLPHLCVLCRFEDRFKFVNPPKFWHAKCHCAGQTSDQQQVTGDKYQNTVSHFHGTDRCLNEFETSYDPKRPEIVYCESCYQSEVA